MNRLFPRYPWTSTLALAALGGGLMSLAHSPLAWWPALWLMPIPIALISLGAGRLQGVAAAVVFAAAGSAGLLSLAWDPAVGAAMVAYRFIVLLVTFLLAHRVRQAWPPAVAVMVYPAVLVAAEFAMSFTPLGTALTDAYLLGNLQALLQLASVTGVYGVSFMAAWFGVAMGLMIWCGPTRESFWPVRIAVAVLVLVTLAGMVRINRGPDTEPVKVAAIHAESFRGKPKTVDQNLERQASYAPLAREAADQGARLIVWPEMILSTDTAWGDSVLAPLSDLVRETGACHVVGFYHRDAQRNTARIIGPDGTLYTEYQKTHLVTAMETSHPGTEPAPVVNLDGVALGVMICNDDVFTDVARQLGRDGARLVADPTWDWRDVADKHAQIPRLRAIENGFAMVRATQGGISQLIDARGGLVGWHSALDEPRQVLVGELRPGGGSTVYSRLGDVFAWLVVVGLAVLVVRRPRESANNAP